MIADQDGPTASRTQKGHAKTHSRSLSLRAIPIRLRPKTAPSSPDLGEEQASGSTKLAPPLPESPRIRRSSAPQEGATTPEWRANQFTTPLEADAEFVRRTYAHFSIAGVPDDGFSDGKEYTRERNGLSAWEEAALSRPSSLVPARRQVEPPASTQASPQIVQSDSFSKAGHSAAASQANGRINGHVPPRLNNSDSTRSALSQLSSQSTHADPHVDGRAAVVAAQLADTSVSKATFLSTNERERRQAVADKKRQETIANIDRYGFFSGLPGNVHHKATLLSSSLFLAPFPRKAVKLRTSRSLPMPSSLAHPSAASSIANEAGGDADPSHEVHQVRAAADAAHRQREQERIAKWTRMLTVKDRDPGLNAVEFDFANGVDRRLRRRVFKGIPDSWRAAAWSALLQRRRQTDEGRRSYALAKPHILTAATQSDDESFERLKHMASPHDVQIDLDVPRTISGHIQFHTRYGQGQRSLFHVLHALSILCEQCAYCQGMGPIAATLLCYLSPERAYAAMVAMHNHVNLHTTFSPGFPGLVENLFVQDQLLRKYMPEIAATLDEHMIVASSYATKWYITLFSNSIPFETQLRVWDAWLLDGQDVITLVAVAIIWAHRGAILQPNADFETILSALSSFFVPENDDALLFWVRDALARRDVRSSMQRARDEYRQKAESGQAAALML
ncbi:rabGAP/TBC [Moesziomyces antarcticus]|uniref:Related to GYP5 - GTPase-activating protein for Ypt Proteins n=2 Tax=Pseudozyma antarctica TaxID=84753 RepID=A0A5C3FSA3_PSEA2|nr:rabGAP/TBC [Moesziomyces antarcticus]GAK68265.1 rabGAP/TBC [Moesziomyces antarcticus]SPO47324.1 related to GYP5 - GTPase-activating protein for Ypt Proteins [Moesziomyces antarcticus]